MPDRCTDRWTESDGFVITRRQVHNWGSTTLSVFRQVDDEHSLVVNCRRRRGNGHVRWFVDCALSTTNATANHHPNENNKTESENDKNVKHCWTCVPKSYHQLQFVRMQMSTWWPDVISHSISFLRWKIRGTDKSIRWVLTLNCWRLTVHTIAMWPKI